MAAATVSYRVNAERVVLIGWLRALLLQIAHPLIAAGVARHSSFRASTASSLGRLRQTVGAMLAITFGTPDRREAALEGIRIIHRRVHGTLGEACGAFPAGTAYSAEDSDLLIWVHVTLVESILVVYERLVEPLSIGERDRFCADSADVAIALGACDETVPRSWSTVRAHIEDGYATGRVAVGADARALAAVLLSPLRVTILRPVIASILQLFAAGLVPAHIREQYGFAWDARRTRRFDRAMRLLRLLRRWAPARLAIWKIARCAACFETRRDTRPRSDDPSDEGAIDADTGL